MARLWLIVLAAASPVWGQFFDLATTTDGSVLYFASSLRVKGTTQPLHSKIFRYDARGLSLYAALERIVISETDRAISNYFHLSMPQVSGDGSRVIYTGLASCIGRRCPPGRLYQTEPFQLPAKVRLSRNGRYAVCAADGPTCALWDLETGQVSDAPKPGNDLGMLRHVADDGSFPFISNAHLFVRRNRVDASLTSIFAEEPVQPAIHTSATKIVFTSRWQAPHDTFSRIREVNLATGALRTLAEGYGDLMLPSLSDDGQWVLFLSTARFDGSHEVGVPQAYILDVDRTGLRLLPNTPEGVTTAILSGNGKVVYAVTPLGRLLKVDADSGAVSEVIPRTLTLPESLGCVPGSICTLTGTGFLPGASLTVGGINAPIISLSSNDIQFQMPWELSPTASPVYELVLTTPPSDSSPFETTTAPKVSAPDYAPYVFVSPVPERAAGFYSQYSFALSQNFDAIISPLVPARPGDIIHAYVTGLGPGAAPQKTSVPAPADPLPSTKTPISCQNAEVLYSGLAPGFLGLYQIDLRLSPSLIVPQESGGFFLICRNFYLVIAGTNPQ